MYQRKMFTKKEDQTGNIHLLSAMHYSNRWKYGSKENKQYLCSNGV